MDNAQNCDGSQTYGSYECINLEADHVLLKYSG
jgi:hypothetical protein